MNTTAEDRAHSAEDRARSDVLIVDDDRLVRRSLRLLLEAHGYTCAEASNGRQAVELARQRQPRCIFLDLWMPEPDGLTVARMLRADPRTSALHIHAITGVPDWYVSKQAQAAGCERFLTKPLELATLLEAVRSSEPVAAPAAAPGDTLSSVSGLTLAEAEGLLDWLQNQGCTRLEAALQGGRVTVRCVCPTGLRLGREASGAVRLLKA